MMSIEQEIGVGLEKSEREGMHLFLEKFLPHAESDKLVACGGLATRFHLAVRGLPSPNRPFNDLDLLIETPSDIKPSVSSDFMIYHYHPPGVDDPVETTYFFYAFVDPESRMKADVFPYRWSTPERFINAQFRDGSIKLVGIEDQMIQCLYDVSRISSQQKVDPKQLDDVHALAQIADIELAQDIWRQNNHPSYPRTLKEAIKRADNIRVEHPELWQAKPYRKSKPYKCAHCQDRPDYPIADMTEVYKVLGYVE